MLFYIQILIFLSCFVLMYTLFKSFFVVTLINKVKTSTIILAELVYYFFTNNIDIYFYNLTYFILFFLPLTFSFIYIFNVKFVKKKDSILFLKQITLFFFIFLLFYKLHFLFSWDTTNCIKNNSYLLLKNRFFESYFISIYVSLNINNLSLILVILNNIIILLCIIWSWNFNWNILYLYSYFFF